MKKKFKYVYGPVFSWRLGVSLGIDPISAEHKICSFNCTYCQLGETKVLSDERKDFVSVSEIIEEIDLLPSLSADVITFSGRGEPTLAANLGQMLRAIKKIRKERLAVITNTSLISREDVRNDLSYADIVIAKLDAPSQKSFEVINQPIETVCFDALIQGIKNFRNIFKGKLALQVMFISKNKEYAEEIARIAKEISPAEVQINTPLRPCKERPLPKAELDILKKHFEGLKSISVYDIEKKKVQPLSDKNTLERRGKAY
ncbi:MAG: radical SAM protein [Candidatus Omnitrophota bacterium]|nr:radical SAM protein [Candidatus Omnitrophota bacterium]